MLMGSSSPYSSDYLPRLHRTRQPRLALCSTLSGPRGLRHLSNLC